MAERTSLDLKGRMTMLCLMVMIQTLSFSLALPASVPGSSRLNKRESSQCIVQHPCGHGFCVELETGYKCVCPHHHTGQNCEISLVSRNGEEIAMLRKQEEELRRSLGEAARSEDVNSLLSQMETRLRTAMAEKLANITSQYESLQSDATNKINALEDKTQYLGDGCNLKTIGYKYHVEHDMEDETNNGKIASITFKKKLNQTILGLSYASNIRVHNVDSPSRWYFQIDGQECSRPAKLDIALHQGIVNNRMQPSVLKGVCQATSAGNIGQGQHTISVHVQAIYGNSDAHSKWRSTSTLEVQEMCPPF